MGLGRHIGDAESGRPADVQPVDAFIGVSLFIRRAAEPLAEELDLLSILEVLVRITCDPDGHGLAQAADGESARVYRGRVYLRLRQVVRGDTHDPIRDYADAEPRRGRSFGTRGQWRQKDAQHDQGWQEVY